MKKWQTKGGLLTVSDGRPLIMGILNITPDSFSDGGLYLSADAALSRAAAMVAEGADIIDIGGQSTRPGHTPISPEEEWSRLEGILPRLCRELSVPISVDTYYPFVAERALHCGAAIINDVTGFDSPEMRALAAKHGCGCVVMHHDDITDLAAPTADRTDSITNCADPAANLADHIDPHSDCTTPVINCTDLNTDRATPAANRADPIADRTDPIADRADPIADRTDPIADRADPIADRADPIADRADPIAAVREFFERRVEECMAAGIAPEQIALDIGIGFGKTREQELELLKRCGECRVKGLPIFVGASRKRFIAWLMNAPDSAPEQRDAATHEAHAIAINAGANIIRVHDVLGAAKKL